MKSKSHEIDMLDLLVLVTEHWKSLLLVPTMAGLSALGLTYVIPQTYTSQAILSTSSTSIAPQQLAAMMVTPMVLDSAAKSLRTNSGLESRVKVVVGKNNLLHLEASAASPQEAQALANAVIDAWLKTTASGSHEGENLLKLVKQPPTLPTAPIAPKKRLVVVLSVLFASLLMFLWILLSRAWVRAAQIPESAQQQQRVLAALGLGGKSAAR